MKVDVENLIELIEHGYPPIKHSAYWQDLLKLIPKDTPESQWPTEEEIKNAGKTHGTRVEEIMKEFTFWLGQNHLPIVSAMHFEMFLNSKKV